MMKKNGVGKAVSMIFLFFLINGYGTRLESASITVTSPNGGEIWILGNSYAVKWTQMDVSGMVNIDLYKGGSWNRFIGSALATLGSFNWVIPSFITPGSNYSIRISQGAVADASDNPFSLLMSYPQMHTVTFIATAGGTISGENPQTVAHGGNGLPVSAVPSTGYRFVNWTGTGGFSTTTSNPLTVTNVQNDMSITAHFTLDTTVTYSVSGRITHQGSGLAGVLLEGLSGNPVTDAAGSYSTKVAEGWSGIVRPKLTGYTFSPQLRNYQNVNRDWSGQDYVASGQGGTYFTVSGKVKQGTQGLVGVAMTGFPSGAVTDATGSYSASVPAGWSGNVIPHLSGYTFSPSSRTYADVQANQANQDYSASVPQGTTYKISGKITENGIGLAGVSLSGFPGNPVSDSSGDYLAEVPAGWSGTVIPTLMGYVFTPGSITYASVHADFYSNYIAEKRNPKVTFSFVYGGRLDGQLIQSIPYGGSTSPVKAIPDAGFAFFGWNSTGGFYSQMNPLVVNSVTRDMVIMANFGENAGDDRIRFIQPVSGEHVWGVLMRVVEVRNDVDVKRVDFFVDGRNTGAPSSSSGEVNETSMMEMQNNKRFMAEWNTTSETFGWHRLEAKGTGPGNETFTAKAMVYVENVQLLLQVQRLENRGLRLRSHYADLQIEAVNLGMVTVGRYEIFRAGNDEEFALIKEIGQNEFQKGRYRFFDVSIETTRRYRYKVVVYDIQGLKIGEAEEVSI